MPNLLFRRPRDPAQRDLVFGRPAGPVLDAEGRLAITLPPAGLQLSGRLAYDNAVSRSDIIGAVIGWRTAEPVPIASRRVAFAPAVPTGRAFAGSWRQASPLPASAAIAWRNGERLRASSRLRWGRGDAVPALVTSAGWQDAERLRNTTSARAQNGAPIRIGAGSPWQVAVIIRPSPRLAPARFADPISAHIRTAAGPAQPVPLLLRRIPWGLAARLPPGRTAVIVTPPPEPWRCYTPPPGDQAHLLFDERLTGSTDILFSCGAGAPSGALIIPTLRAYIVVNSATLTRVSNGLALPLRDISISGDADSVHWTWSATLPLRALPDLEPDMPGQLVELEARLNDMPWRLLVEKRSEAERFGSASLRISGRGIAAELSAPGAAAVPRSNLSAATAQQLAADALTINGVSNGWTLTWQGADWLLPAGLWAHTGTPMEAVLRLATAAGAYVLPAPAARSLALLPRNPAAPWEWAGLAPGVVLPAAATLERGSEEIVRPGYNAVYVCGEGLTARVRRAGSAGDRAAQMVVDELISHADAARQRGIEVLAAASSHRLERLETGILPGYGVIQIGTVLDWVRGPATRRGIVRELSVAASMPQAASRDPVKVRQTLGVEIHG